MIRHVPAPVSFMHVDSSACQNFIARQNVLLLGVATHCDHMRVFDKQQSVRALAALTLIDETLLNGKSIGIP